MRDTVLPSPAQSGFTLIELLVSLVVLSLGSSLLLVALGGAWRSNLLLKPGLERHESVIAAHRSLRMRIEAMASIVRNDTAEPVVDAQGDARAFSFYAPAFPRSGPNALQRFRLQLTSSGDLILYSASGLDSRIDLRDRSLVGWQPTRLLSGASGLELSYYGPDRFSPNQRWQSLWSDRAQPPEMIRVRVRFPAEDSRQWPELVIRPRTTVNTACRIEVFSGRCGVN